MANNSYNNRNQSNSRNNRNEKPSFKKFSNYEPSKKTFINPYTFVSVKDEIKNKQNAESRKEESLLTGCIKCKLTVETPLAIPDALTKKEMVKEHFRYDAFRMGDEVVIPGSSIRGALRSVYEALTNSCMVTTNGEEHITKRSDLGVFRPGVLKLESTEQGNREWRLYEAKRIALVSSNYKKINDEPGKVQYSRFNIQIEESTGKKYIESANQKLYNGQEVAITLKDVGHKKQDKKKNTSREVWDYHTIDTISQGRGTNCFLYLGEVISNKHAESVFQTEKKPLDLSSDMIQKAMRALEDTLLMYRSESVNRNLASTNPLEKHYGYRGYEGAKSSGNIPLWFQEKSGKLYLSMAAIGRISYHNSMSGIMNGHAPCKSRNHLCPACSVFGMVGKEKDSRSLGSHIRVTDAYGIRDISTTAPNYITLKELGSPRTSYLKFYSVDGREYDEEKAQIRGRKFYWHIPEVNNNSTIFSTTEKTKRNASFELIEKDNEFIFDVFYDSITDDELNMLLWTIALPSEVDEKGKQRILMHKLGHGKPLGLGSIRIEILGIRERINDNGYQVKAEEKVSVEKSTLMDANAWKQMTKILEYNPESKAHITYPYIERTDAVQKKIKQWEKKGYTAKENLDANHQWFSNNSATLPDSKSGLPVYMLANITEPKPDREQKKNGDFNPPKKNDNFNNKGGFNRSNSKKK